MVSSVVVLYAPGQAGAYRLFESNDGDGSESSPLFRKTLEGAFPVASNQLCSFSRAINLHGYGKLGAHFTVVSFKTENLLIHYLTCIIICLLLWDHILLKNYDE